MLIYVPITTRQHPAFSSWAWSARGLLPFCCWSYLLIDFHYVCNIYNIAQPCHGSLPCMLVTPKIKAFVLINMNKGQSSSSVQCLQTAQLTLMSVFLLLYLQIGLILNVDCHSTCKLLHRIPDTVTVLPIINYVWSCQFTITIIQWNISWTTACVILHSHSFHQNNNMYFKYCPGFWCMHADQIEKLLHGR